MKYENGKIEGNLDLTSGLELHGIVTGNIRVLPGVTLFLHGTCGENLIVESNATAYVHGTVGGNVENRGGLVEIYGTVNGQVLKISGSTVIDKNAVILNKR
jgi:hypothetical protein